MPDMRMNMGSSRSSSSNDQHNDNADTEEPQEQDTLVASGAQDVEEGLQGSNSAPFYVMPDSTLPLPITRDSMGTS